MGIVIRKNLISKAIHILLSVRQLRMINQRLPDICVFVRMKKLFVENTNIYRTLNMYFL